MMSKQTVHVFSVGTYLWAAMFACLFVLAGVISSYVMSAGMISQLQGIQDRLNRLDEGWHKKIDDDLARVFEVIRTNQQLVMGNQQLIERNQKLIEANDSRLDKIEADSKTTLNQ